MKSVMSQLGELKYFDHPIYHHANDCFVVLGKYQDGVFQGTDRLSMGIQPKAVEFCLFARKRHILLEGDRLGNAKFIEAMRPFMDVKIYIVKCDAERKKMRHENRNDTQTEAFKKSKKTKVENLAAMYSHEVLINNDLDDLNRNSELIRKNFLD